VAQRLADVDRRLIEATRLALEEGGWPTKLRDGSLELRKLGLSLRLHARYADPDTEVGYGIALTFDLSMPDALGGRIRFETFQFGTSLDDATTATGRNLTDGFLFPLRMLLDGPESPGSEQIQILTHDVEQDRSAWWDVVIGPLHLIRTGPLMRAEMAAHPPFAHLRDWYVGHLSGHYFHWMVIFVSYGEAGLGGGIVFDGQLFAPPPTFDTYQWAADQPATVVRQYVLSKRSRRRGEPVTARA
jgi:hypothetical protein